MFQTDTALVVKDLKIIFSKLRQNILSIRKKSKFNNENNFSFKNTFNFKKQINLAHELANLFGFDKNIGRIELSEHPFSSGEGDDVRITTRLSKNDPFPKGYRLNDTWPQY